MEYRTVPRVLVLTPYYLPGFKSGGPVRSLASMIARLRGPFGFQVLTSDREPGELRPFPGVRAGQWQPVEGVQVLYVTPGIFSVPRISATLLRCEFDVLYLNSVFSPLFTVLPLALVRLFLGGRVRVVIASRGELSRQALAWKAMKKRGFLALSKAVGLYSRVVWHAASERERADIHVAFGSKASVEIAADMVSEAPFLASRRDSDKTPGALRIVYLARIAPIKNLRLAIECLRTVRGDVKFDIYGPIADHGYWRECAAALATLPPNVESSYRGVVAPDKVHETLSGYDLYFLPSESESFGHGIYEAMSAGCPVLIGDRTPWSDVKARFCGWALPLDSPSGFSAVLQECVGMDGARLTAMRESARQYARDFREDTARQVDTEALFRGTRAGRD